MLFDDLEEETISPLGLRGTSETPQDLVRTDTQPFGVAARNLLSNNEPDQPQGLGLASGASPNGTLGLARPDAPSGGPGMDINWRDPRLWAGIVLQGVGSALGSKQPSMIELMEHGRRRHLDESRLRLQQLGTLPTLLEMSKFLRDEANLTDEQKKTFAPRLAEMFQSMGGLSVDENFTAGLLTGGSGRIEALKVMYPFLSRLPESRLLEINRAIQKNPANAEKVINTTANWVAGQYIQNNHPVPAAIARELTDDQRAQHSIEARTRNLPALSLSSAEKVRQDTEAKGDKDKPPPSVGTDREALAQERGFKTFSDAPQEAKAQINKEVKRREDERLRLQGVQVNLQQGGQTFKNAESLRDNFQKLSDEFIKVRDSYNRVVESTKNPSPAGDLSAIFAYMKLLDPGSVVRESEFRVAETARPLLEKAGISWDRVSSVWQGKRLTDSQRADFLKRADSLYDQQERSHNDLRSEYRRIAIQSGLNPDVVIPDFRIRDRTQNQPGGTNRPKILSIEPAR